MSEVKENVINLWDKVAPEFGKIGPKYWNDFGKILVELSEIKRGAKVLDIGMGRGASLFPAIIKVGKEGYIVGIDNSEVMVNETHKDILDKNIVNAKVIKMNAQCLEFEEESFDNVICGFGFGFLIMSENKLEGLKAILKNGGQAGFSIWGTQEDQKWLTEIINKYIPPNTQNMNNKKADIPKFDETRHIIKILEDSGFCNIKVHEENADVVYSSKEEWWQEMWSNAVRGIFERIENLGADVFKEFKVEVFNGLEKFRKAEGFHFNMVVIYAFGAKIDCIGENY